MAFKVKGDAIIPATIVTGRQVVQGPAIRVFNAAASPRKVEGGAAEPVVAIADTDLVVNGGEYRVMSGPAIPMVNLSSRQVKGGPAIPVYPVDSSGAYDSSFAAIFSPLDISGLVLWLKGDAITGLDDDDPVAIWEDQSGLGNDVTQAAGAKRPTYKTGIINGKAVVRFDGTDDFLSIGSDVLSADYNDFTVIIVLNAPDLFERRSLFQRTRVDVDNSLATSVDLQHAGEPGIDDYLPGGGQYYSAHVVDDASDRVIFFARTGNTRHIYVDSNVLETEAGAEVYAGGAPTQTNIGCDVRFSGETNHFTGDMAELAVYDSELTADNWAIWKTYLNGRYNMGLT